jgi:hypothetical protein
VALRESEQANPGSIVGTVGGKITFVLQNEETKRQPNLIQEISCLQLADYLH